MRSIDVFGHEDIPALTAAQARSWDLAAREQHGIPERVLMENAGRALATILHKLYPTGRVLAVVGSGHNGGDALIALRLLHTWGREVEWVVAGARAPDLAVLHGYPLAGSQSEDTAAAARTAAVIIDGLLGTGTSGPPRESVARAIAQVNAAQRPVVAVDLPSGVHPDTGRVESVAMHAQVTVCLGALKVGLLLQPARSHCGRVMVAEIGFPPLEADGVIRLITPAWAQRRLPQRAASAHKGTAGRVLLLAGSRGMAGAAALAAQGALRAGAGLVCIASSAENREILQSLVPEATFFDRAAALPAASMHALAAGCGLGRDEPALEALERALDVTDTLPVVLDADALNLLAERPDSLSRIGARRPVVLTPHQGEFVRLSGIAEADLRQDPIARAREFAQQTHAVVLLKGQPSLVAAPDGSVLLNTTGSSDLATGGTGDQLAGMIGAFLAAGVAARDAAALALFYGGRAADLAARGRALSPQDVSAHLHRAFRSPGARTSPLGLPFICFDQPARW